MQTRNREPAMVQIIKKINRTFNDSLRGMANIFPDSINFRLLRSIKKKNWALLIICEEKNIFFIKKFPDKILLNFVRFELIKV